MSPSEIAVALIHREGRLFLQRRSVRARILPGLWELPGGKIEPGESPEQALSRELEEELRWRPERMTALDCVAYDYADRSVLLHPFRCAGPGPLHSPLAWGWFRPEEFRQLALPGATQLVLNGLGS